jgi:penicillin V acylase-like amidase (Ntn superfamily)
MRCVRFFLVIAFFLWLAPDGFSCSSFTLKDGDRVIVGRNLESGGPQTGFVVVNKRGVRKESRSWMQLFWDREVPGVPMSWVSEYGSITFNTSLEFPDGGINEAGLVFEEMTLLRTKYPTAEGRAPIFMILWIQYILDTCATVDEVIAAARSAVIDGWNWHFWAADAAGASAVIEFLDGEAVIKTGADLPYPLLCNSVYTEEVEQLDTYDVFGGTVPLDTESQFSYEGPETDTRFARGAYNLSQYDPSGDVPPLDYAFKVVDVLAAPNLNQLQKIYDVSARRVYFRTPVAPRTRWVDLGGFDLACDSPPKVLDIQADLEGDVTGNFVAYTEKANRAALERDWEHFRKHPEAIELMRNYDTTPEQIMDRLHAYTETVRCTMVPGMTK